MNRRVILASLLALSLAGCATDGYDGGYYGDPYSGDPYYGGPDYIAPGPVYYGGGAAYYRRGYPYRYRHSYNPHPGNWNGHGTRPWRGGVMPNYVQPSGRPGLQGQPAYHPNYHSNTPGHRPIRRYD